MSHGRVERRLAAILAADIVGYSRLMGEDEAGTLAQLRTHRRELIDPKIAEYRGRIVKTTGDGLLAEFASVIDALSCAVAWQTAVPAENRIAWRIGIHQGDVVVEDGDIFGDGVNVAARLEGLAAPGGICISARVQEDTIGKLDLPFEDIGEQNLKNIARPVRAYRLGTRAFPSDSRTTVPANRGPRLSIVVLPFTNLSNDPEQQYFVDAITDDLTTDLSRIAGSFVIARTTAFTYRGKTVDVKEIGRELGVRYVLEGSVRRLGDEVQVNVQLIDAESGAHVWADRFNTDRANLIKAQEEITSRLARTLDIALVQAAGRQIDPEKNPDARDLIMRGWALYYSPQVHWQEAKQSFEKALELDPQSNRAKIALARMLAESIPRGLSKSREQDIARAEKLISEAVQWDTSADAYYALGIVHRVQNRLTESRSELENAISLNRNHGSASLQLGITLLFSGEPELALQHLEQALRLTPNSANTHFFYFWLGFDYLLMSQSDLRPLEPGRTRTPCRNC